MSVAGQLSAHPTNPTYPATNTHPAVTNIFVKLPPPSANAARPFNSTPSPVHAVAHAIGRHAHNVIRTYHALRPGLLFSK